LTGQSRRTIVAVLLMLFACWPFVQQQLVIHYRINPWKLAGWAMYTTTTPRGNMNLIGIDTAGERTPLNVRESQELFTARNQYMSSRLTMGLFVDPAPVASALATAHPKFSEWELVVNEIGLARDGWVDVVHRTTYRFARTETGVEQVGVTYSVPTLDRTQ